MSSMGQVPSIVSDLIERFEQNRDAYKSQAYNETQLRREFLDHFESRGWKIRHDRAAKGRHVRAFVLTNWGVL